MAKRRVSVEDPVAAIQQFFSYVGDGGSVIIGIDPGVKGALAFLPCRMRHNNKVSPALIDIPTEKLTTKSTKNKSGKKVRTRYDLYSIHVLFDVIAAWQGSVVVVLEKTQPMRGDTPVTAYAMGGGFWMWPLYLLGRGLALETVLPVVWKRRMGLLKQDKTASMIKAKELFPEVSAFIQVNDDNNRAEALLIAESVRRARGD